MALCPDVVPFIDGRFNCRDLLQRSVIHYGSREAVCIGVPLFRRLRRVVARPAGLLGLDMANLSYQRVALRDG